MEEEEVEGENVPAKVGPTFAPLRTRMPQIPGTRLSTGSIVVGMVASGVGLNMAEARSCEEDEVPRAMRRRRTRSR